MATTSASRNIFDREESIMASNSSTVFEDDMRGIKVHIAPKRETHNTVSVEIDAVIVYDMVYRRLVMFVW